MESTLSLRLSDFEIWTGNFAGFGGGSNASETAWTTKQQSLITEWIKGGLRRFYRAFNWEFLKPFVTITFPSGASTYVLPDDFCGLEGQLSLSDSANGVYRPVLVYNPGDVEQMYSQYPSQTGCPRAASIQPLKGTQALKGQLQQLFIFPVSDQAYSMTFCYYINPDYLVSSTPYAYGGSEHTETIKYACLAECETQFLNRSDGPMLMAYQRELQNSINVDRRKKPQQMGVNRDRSDEEDWYNADLTRYWGNLSPVTYTPS